MKYIVAKPFIYKEQPFPVNRIVDGNAFGKKLPRFIKGKYITPIEEMDRNKTAEDEVKPDGDRLPFYLTVDGFLTPEQVDKLRNKKEVLEYGEHIGVEGLDPSAKLPDLKAAVKEFIKTAEDDAGDPDKVNDPNKTGDNDSDNGNA